MRKIRRKQVGHHRLGAERLEQRTMLAGDVDFFVDGGGNLRINGDGAANDVSVELFAPNFFLITGVLGTGTTLNNGLFASGVPAVVGPVAGDVIARMAGGDDFLDVFAALGGTLPGDLDIKMGGGNDTAAVEDLSVAELKVEGESGNDHIDIFDVTAFGKAEVKANTGNDIVHVFGGGFGGSFLLHAGVGHDTAEIDGAAFGRNTTIDMDSGDDFLSIADSLFSGKTNIATNTGNDSVGIRAGTEFRGGLNLDTGVGNDTVIIGATTFAGKVEIGMGRGNDSLTIAASTFLPGTNVRLKGEQDFDTISDNVGNIGYLPALKLKTGFELDI